MDRILIKLLLRKEKNSRNGPVLKRILIMLKQISADQIFGLEREWTNCPVTSLNDQKSQKRVIKKPPMSLRSCLQTSLGVHKFRSGRQILEIYCCLLDVTGF
jgi:hypothetical protein